MDEPEAQQKITNPATRLVRLTDEAAKGNTGHSAARVWAGVFGLPPESENDPHDIVTRLGMMRDEVALLERMMAQTKFSPYLYESTLKRLRHTISISNLESQWGNLNGHIQDEHRLALRFCSEIIDGDVEIPRDELQAVLDKVHEFRSEIENGTVPEPARSFILHQLELIEKGIQEYPIRGNTAVRSAFKNAVAEASVVESETISQAPEEVSKMAYLWKAFQSTCKGVTETEKAVKALAGLVDTVPKLIDSASKALSG